MTHAEIKEKMIWAGKVLVNEGQDDFTRGHISVRLPDNPSLFFMKCHSVGLDEITAENILTIDLEGKVVAGTSRRHSEVYIHSEIFKVRPDVHCILHTHPLYSIVWSGGGRPLKAISQPARAVPQRHRHLHRHHQPDPQPRDGRRRRARHSARTAW